MRGWFCVLLVGCYHPSFQPGLPCSENGTCPGDQQCDHSQSPPLCLDPLSDAGVPDPDAVDAPLLSCSLGCSGDTPFCDEPTQICRGCIADVECASEVCHELTGDCIPAGNALYVAPNAAGNTCSHNSPCGSIGEADAQRTAQRYVIKVADGRYLERVELKVGNGANLVVISGPDRSWDGPEIVADIGSNRVDQNVTVVFEGVTLLASPQAGLDSQGTVTLSGVLVRNSGDTGVIGRGPMTRILDSRVDQSSSSGVQLFGGVGQIERTVIMSNDNGGVRIEPSAGFSIINTIIASNGSAQTANSAVRIVGAGPVGGPAVFRFNTVASNVTQLGSPNGFDCGRPVIIESSIVANPTAIFQNEWAGMFNAQTSLFGTSTPPTMGNNLTGTPMFVSTTDFHVIAASPAVDAAPVAGAPGLDVDGQPRSGVDPPDIGADEVP